MKSSLLCLFTISSFVAKFYESIECQVVFDHFFKVSIFFYKTHEKKNDSIHACISHRLKPGKIESSQIRCSMCMNFKIGQCPHVSFSVYIWNFPTFSKLVVSINKISSKIDRSLHAKSCFIIKQLFTQKQI